jgi:hypothetical protein
VTNKDATSSSVSPPTISLCILSACLNRYHTALHKTFATLARILKQKWRCNNNYTSSVLMLTYSTYKPIVPKSSALQITHSIDINYFHCVLSCMEDLSAMHLNPLIFKPNLSPFIYWTRLKRRDHFKYTALSLFLCTLTFWMFSVLPNSFD